MALTALLLFLTLGVISSAIPLPDDTTVFPDVEAVVSLLFAPPLPQLATTTALETLTDTQTVTAPPTTVTVSLTPSAITSFVTVFIPTPLPPASASPMILPTSAGSQTIWSAPAQMTDLSAFNVSAFPGGQQNLQVVDGIPADASATVLSAAAADPTPSGSSPMPTWENSSSVLQLLYPANSINPASKPQGGAEFYASPLQIASASSVSLLYSVFFPAGFDWVLAGKLPGIYGGHTGCSGGADALDCFSTRLMWREDGKGELYLYAPKEKQTHALCADPQSVCDATYGLSVGRGSFNWSMGAWTTVLQTVTLNTPGKQDGSFTLDVDGRRVIGRNDVFYRDAPASQSKATPLAKKPLPVPTLTTTDGDILDSIISGIFARTVAVEDHIGARPTLVGKPRAVAIRPRNEAQMAWAVDVAPIATTTATTTTAIIAPTTVTTATANTTTTVTVVATSTVFPSLLPIEEQTAERGDRPVGFIGLFFSTFFGGHEQQYATPRDQYVWFKDFAMSYNS